MTTYALQGPPHAGATITPGAVASGDLCPTGQGIGLLVVNNSASPLVVTLPVALTYDGLAVASRTVTVPAIAGAIPGLSIIPTPDGVYGVGTTVVNYGSTTTITAAAIRIP